MHRYIVDTLRLLDKIFQALGNCKLQGRNIPPHVPCPTTSSMCQSRGHTDLHTDEQPAAMAGHGWQIYEVKASSLQKSVPK